MQQSSHQEATLCEDSDNAIVGAGAILDTAMPPHATLSPTLPLQARLPFNRCNLPAVILGSLTFQRFPSRLALDGVRELHGRLFARQEQIDDAPERAHLFQVYMQAHFCLNALEEAGFDARNARARGNADYLRLLRGWLFDADGRDGAVIKGWVESRFGLVTRYHGGSIPSPDAEAYRRFLEARSAGLYATNALEAQLDLVYEFCQDEIHRQFPRDTHLRLFRGVNRIGDHETLATFDKRRKVLLLNNINSFTSNRERAGEFGDYILEAEVPLSKIFFFSSVLPGTLKGEDELMVIGGVYEVKLRTV